MATTITLDKVAAQIAHLMGEVEAGIGELDEPAWAHSARDDVYQTLLNVQGHLAEIYREDATAGHIHAFGELGRAQLNAVLSRLQIGRANGRIDCPFRGALDGALSDLALTFARLA